jgi:hypothetical protein
MTRETILQHVAFMRQHEPAYAEKALRWYAKCLPWLGLDAS